MKITLKKVHSCLIICIVLLVFPSGNTYAQDSPSAATKNTWYASGLLNMDYSFPQHEGYYTDKSASLLEFNARALWFAFDGLGAGIDAEFNYFDHEHFSDVNIGIGPRAAYFLRLTEWQKKLLPYIGCSFFYTWNDTDPGQRETGWRLELGLGISPLIGNHLTIPVELGFSTDRLTIDHDKEGTNATTNSRIYLKVGIGGFLWKKSE